MNGEVIKEFLVSLNFGVDDSSLQKFNSAIASAGTRVAALGAAVVGAATAIFYGISNISQSFEDMGYEMRIIAPAINKALVMRNALLDAYRHAGVNLVKVVQQSVLFNLSLAKTKFALDAIYKSVGARFLPMLTKQLDIFRNKLYANMPRIQAGLEKFVKFCFSAFSIVVQLGERIWSILTRVYDFFAMLDEKTNGWSTIILAVVAAWKLLNLSFIATPIGAVITGLLALLAIWDDFKTHQEGGESFFNWDTGPMIKIVNLFQTMYDLVKGIAGFIGDAANGDFSGLSADISKVTQAFMSLNTVIDGLLSSFHVGWIDKLLSWRDGAESTMMTGLATGSTSMYGGAPFANAQLGAGPGAGGVSQNMNSNATINVQTSDPTAAANQVLGAQKNVNADASRNLKGRAR
jgi:hypothetical protein